MPDQILLSLEALEKLKKELNVLKTTRRKEVAKRIQIAKDHGDLSENAEYHDAKDEQAFLEGKIAELDNKVKFAQVAENTGDGTVNLGCEVTVNDDAGKEQKFTVVSFNEADPAERKISNVSPFGAALIGRAKGDDIEVELPKGVKKFKIVGIKC